MNRFLPFLTAALSLTMIGPALAADRVALVIGVDEYKNLPPEAQLRVAASDATLMAQTLESLNPPFDVTLLTNVSQDNAERALDTFVGKAEGAECALVYFAGHGIEFHGENYLLVSDTNISAKPDEGVRRVKDRLYYESLSLHKLMEDLNETGANLQLVILDACRDNPLEIEAPNGTRSIMGSQGGLGRVNAPSGMLISYSADAGQQANDGLFTSILAAQLKTPGSTLMEVFAQTRLEVRKQATVLQAEGKGVLHEPAEYSKLEPSALRFSFVKGDGNPRPAPSLASTPMVDRQPSEFQSQKVIETKIPGSDQCNQYADLQQKTPCCGRLPSVSSMHGCLEDHRGH